ncbi:hypothetical protein COV19_06235 [Candidatus Woesearchaeota archaeon CG10_big_fil_rev_8_21_14_0_10_44_13]|nr:MAG: hypothetical protein COV19_06235 [Candidatus Woesearchaeota archaeon CG10_big_fil_rev_8_21_14_0_10_44_13]
MMSIWTTLLAGLSYFLGLFVYWLSIIFVLPFKNLEILWILIPIWVNFIFADFFQEKKGTSFGNAIANGAVMLWVGVDWIRFLVRNHAGFDWVVILKFFLCLVVVVWGFLVIYEGIKRKKIIHFIGRIRVVSYVMMVLSPLIYNLTNVTFKYIAVIILFSPVFYLFFELIDKYAPTPRIYEEDEGRSNGPGGFGGLGGLK